jgi:hypothetical protein
VKIGQVFCHSLLELLDLLPVDVQGKVLIDLLCELLAFAIIFAIGQTGSRRSLPYQVNRRLDLVDEIPAFPDDSELLVTAMDVSSIHHKGLMKHQFYF